jgi:hypothetical protein
MKYIWVISFLLVQCKLSDSREKSPNEILSHEEKVVSDEEKYSFDNFKNIFRKIELPYTIYSDSLEDKYNYWCDNDLYDSLGFCKKESLIPKEMARRWIIPFTDTSSKKAPYIQVGSYNIDQVYDDPSYWITLEPLIMLDLPTCDILFVLHYRQTSAVNGGYTHLLAMRYTKDGHLLSAKEIARYGCHTTVDTDTETYWGRITDITSFVVDIKSLDRISVLTKEIREIEKPQESPPVTATARGTKRTIMSLE